MIKRKLKEIKLYKHTFEFEIEEDSKEKGKVEYFDQAFRKSSPLTSYDFYYKVKRVDVDEQMREHLNNGVVYTPKNCEKVSLYPNDIGYKGKELYNRIPSVCVKEETLKDRFLKPFYYLFGKSLPISERKIVIDELSKVWDSENKNKKTENVKLLPNHKKLENDIE